MKRIYIVFALILIVVICFALAACGETPTTPADSNTVNSGNHTPADNGGNTSVVPSDGGNGSGEGSGSADAHTHTYSTAWARDNDYHWHDATCGHDVVAEKAAHTWQVTYTLPATETTAGISIYTCAVCGATKTENVPVTIDEHTHTYSPNWTTDDTYHWHAATCGHSIEQDKAQHRWDDGVITTAATETTEGVRTYTCTVCGATKTETFSLHTHQYGEWAITRQPTCTEEGVLQKTCACGDIVTETINKLPHTEAIDAAVPATCTETGLTEGKHCSVCGEVLIAQQEVAALHHQYDSDVTPPTCTERGYTTYTCQRCGDSYVSDYVPALDHTYGEWVVADAATCSAYGRETRTCTVCGATEERRIDKSAHTYGDWVLANAATCTEDGLRYRICTVCGNIERETLYATGHQGERCIVTEPKCLTAGKQTVTCTKCGQTSFESIPALGHTDGDWVIEKESTCGVGAKRYRCERCAYTVCEAIPADITKQHNYVDDVCTVCGEHKGTSGLQYQINGNSARVVGYTGTDTEIYIPSTYAGAMVIEIGRTFEKNTTIKSVNIPISVTSIGAYAFSGCSRLTSITIPEGVTSIGNDAFFECSGLTSITIPDSVTSIGGSAFCGSGLTTVTIPDSVTSIGRSAFGACRGLTTVTIPDSVTSIGEWAFNNCIGLTTVTIPDSVTSIGAYVFSYCRGLTSVTIPDSVTSIGECAFYNCSGLTSINYLGTKAQWNAISKGGSWNYDTGNYTIHCTDGDIAK